MNDSDDDCPDLPYRTEEEEATRWPPYFAKDAQKTLIEVLKAKGCVLRMPSGQRADLANLIGAGEYLLSRGFCFRSPFERLARLVHQAAMEVATAQMIATSGAEALLAIADAIHNLDRAMARELRRAQDAFLQVQIWIAQTQRSHASVLDILKASDAEGAYMKLHAVAVERCKEGLERPHDGGLEMPIDLAQEICVMPEFARTELESLVEAKFGKKLPQPARHRAQPR